jgi:hypothetical protein
MVVSHITSSSVSREQEQLADELEQEPFEQR